MWDKVKLKQLTERYQEDLRKVAEEAEQKLEEAI